MRCRKFIVLMLVMAMAVTFLTGCGTRAAQQDEPTEFMAWQFAQAVVKRRMQQPNKTLFPRYRYATIERQDNNDFVVTASVHSRDRDGNSVNFNFTVVARYVGNDVFEEVSVELSPVN